MDVETIPAGITYDVSVDTPSGSNLSPVDQGSDDTVDNDGSSFSLAAPSAGTYDGDTGFYVPTVDFSGVCWYEGDGDGIRDLSKPDEYLKDGCVIQVLNSSDDSLVADVQTAADGSYSVSLPILPDGQNYWFKHYAADSGWVRTQTEMGEDRTVDSEFPGNTNWAAINYPANSEVSYTNVDFGFTPESNESTCGRVFLDVDKNGDYTAGVDTPLSGIDVVPTGSGAVDASPNPSTSDSDGYFCFSGVGPYEISSTPQDSLDYKYSNIVFYDLGYLEHAYLMEERSFATMNGLVWNDLNENGIQENGEGPLDGLAVTITRSDGQNVTDKAGSDLGSSVVITTDGNGKWSITDIALLPSGVTYDVNVELKKDYLVSPINVGADDNIDSEGISYSVSAVAQNTYTNDTGEYIGHPSMTVMKSANVTEGDWYKAGTNVTWTYSVENTGDIPLTNVIITDNRLGPVCTIPVIDINTTDSCNKSGNLL